MCQNLTLECKDNVLEIHKAFIGQDFQELFDCVGYDVRPFQDPCTFSDLTKGTKIKCDGRQSCNISDTFDSLEVKETCPTHVKSFNVEFSCQANQTEGKCTIIHH